MKKLYLLCAGLLLSSSLYAIDYSTKFGKVTTDELAMTVYPQDTTAAAVVLYDIGEMAFDLL